ncbi:hypothetical protein THIARS_60853 [Thiomonas delicata]|uniref:Uncharacterized protein n=1 Tax=Thiomonas delicata TaxID=364030 RepID=A0A238D4P1_THIDL|nr:hypothetical protein THIARS_60853 [Thiomonas delicata]
MAGNDVPEAISPADGLLDVCVSEQTWPRP